MSDARENPFVAPTASAPSSVPPHQPASRREVTAWAMYDWANSAYSTLSITFLVAYLERVVFPPDVWDKTGGVVWAWGISASMLCAAILSPIAGAMADARANKRAWLAGTALGGSLAAMAISLIPPEHPWLITGLFVLASFFFEMSLGFYNGFLPEIADHDTMDHVSAWGYGLGYIGGGLALIAAILLLEFGDSIGLVSPTAPARAGIFLMGA